ncbi:DUF4432 family protein [Nonomuraea salmonea]|uniref:DUF4432 family protein n=1 Tax=Nonomuraea salmonea TaxID=46181 RepID=UPI002FECB2CD
MRRNWAARLRQGTIEGLAAVTLENERLRVTVLPGKGGDVVEFLHKPTDTDLVWLTPRGLRDPREHLQGAPDDVAPFIDHYEGGWQDVFPNGGAPSEYRGARLAQHGEVAGLPWECAVVADSPEEVAVRLSVRTRRLPYRMEKVVRLRSGTAALEIEARATNESGLPLHAMWGQHIVYGLPFLRPGGRIRLPDGVTVIPHETPIAPGGRRVKAGGPWRWPVVPADGGRRGGPERGARARPAERHRLPHRLRRRLVRDHRRGRLPGGVGRHAPALPVDVAGAGRHHGVPLVGSGVHGRS